MIKKCTVLIMLVLLIIASVFAFRIFIVTDTDSENKEQIDFIRDFVDNISESKDGKWLAIDKLYDKSIIQDMSYFPWNYSHNTKLQRAVKVEKTDESQILNCKDYLYKTYKVHDIEPYKVTIRQSYSDDGSKTIVDNIDDIAYLTKKDGRYCLLYTQSLFERLNNGGKGK